MQKHIRIFFKASKMYVEYIVNPQIQYNFFTYIFEYILGKNTMEFTHNVLKYIT